MELTFGTLVGTAIVLIMAATNLKNAYKITAILMIFQLLSFVNLKGNSIYVYHVAAFILLIKMIIRYRSHLALPLPTIIVIFLIYYGISILFPIFTSGVSIIDVDNQLSTVKFSTQQISQYMYLLFAVLIMSVTFKLLKESIISKNTIFDIFNIQYWIAIILGIVQIFSPNDNYNALFRNGVNSPVFQRNSLGQVRMASTFSESSMFMLFIVPILCVYIWQWLFAKKNISLLIKILAGIYAGIESESSSFYLGIILFGFILILFFLFSAIYRRGKLEKKILTIFILIFLAVMSFWQIFRNRFSTVFSGLLVKFNDFRQHIISNAGNVSGFERGNSFVLHINAFLKYPLSGVGFGTLRSYDLLSGWLAQIGIIGIGIYFIFLIKMISKCIKSKNFEIALYIIIYNFIMFTSVPEYNMLFIWIIYGMASYCVHVSTRCRNE